MPSRGDAGAGCSRSALKPGQFQDIHFAKQGAKTFDGNRFAEKISLHFVTTDGLEEARLLACLDAFRQNAKTQAFRHDGDGGGNGGVAAIAGNVADKGTVDLEEIDRET